MKKFFILSSQRSGTTWFCEKIGGMFGRWDVSEETNINWWEEIGDKTFIDKKNLNHHCLDKPNYITSADELSQLTALEAFAVNHSNKIIRKTNYFYKEVYDSLNDNEFVNIMYNQCSLHSILKYPVIHFVRRDSVSQSISNFIAQVTGIYHNNDFYKQRINDLSEKEKKIKLSWNDIYWNAHNMNVIKEVYFKTLNAYHENCLTIFYEDCLDKNYWKNTLNKKLEKFMEDSIQNADYETENKKMEKMFKIKNKDGHGFLTGESYIPFTACKENNLPFSMDSLKKVLEFKQ